VIFKRALFAEMKFQKVFFISLLWDFQFSGKISFILQFLFDIEELFLYIVAKIGH